MIDTHAHLMHSRFDKDRDEVIQRAFESGVEKIIEIGNDMQSSEGTVELAEKYENIFASVGVHPHDVGELEQGDNKAKKQENKKTIEILKALACHPELDSGSHESTDKNEILNQVQNDRKNNKVVAIGEIGLDYFKSTTPKDLQIKWFEAQLDLAKELDLPVVIHCRDAHEDMKKILQSKIPLNPPFPKGEGIRGVIHCFSGSLKDANFYINLGLYISFTGVITYTDEYDEVIKSIPLDKILVETDCPFLAPVPMRGKRNEPAFVKYVVEKIADVRNISINEVEEETAKNAENLFAL